MKNLRDRFKRGQLTLDQAKKFAALFTTSGYTIDYKSSAWSNAEALTPIISEHKKLINAHGAEYLESSDMKLVAFLAQSVEYDSGVLVVEDLAVIYVCSRSCSYVFLHYARRHYYSIHGHVLSFFNSLV